MTSFEFGPRTLSVFLSSLRVVLFSYLFHVYPSLFVVERHVVFFVFYLNFVLYSNYVSYFILNFVKCYMSYVGCFVLFCKFVKVMFDFKLIVFRTLMSFIFNCDKCYFRI